MNVTTIKISIAIDQNLIIINIFFNVVISVKLLSNERQRSGLYTGKEIEYRLPKTTDDWKTNLQVKL